jgi:hypothetical protein
MVGPQLGTLSQVPLREVWKTEATSFTPWLADETNLALLGATLGLELELEGQEQEVGPFRADILCKDTATDRWVLVENQLERTDHTHLGQLLTYAAGLQAVTIVWVAERFTEEHRAALDWLNDITDDRFNFFGVEVELWRIGSSPIAPRFAVISKPNDWTKSVQQGASAVALTPNRQLQLAFWTAFREHMEEHSFVRCQKPLAQNWMVHTIGRSGFNLASVASLWDSDANQWGGELRVELVITHPEAKRIMPMLQRDQTAIEAEVAVPLIWSNAPDKKQAKVCMRRQADLQSKAEWPNYFEWLRTNLEAFQKTFAPRVKALDLAQQPAAI